MIGIRRLALSSSIGRIRWSGAGVGICRWPVRVGSRSSPPRRAALRRRPALVRSLVRGIGLPGVVVGHSELSRRRPSGRRRFLTGGGFMLPRDPRYAHALDQCRSKQPVTAHHLSAPRALAPKSSGSPCRSGRVRSMGARSAFPRHRRLRRSSGTRTRLVCASCRPMSFGGSARSARPVSGLMYAARSPAARSPSPVGRCASAAWGASCASLISRWAWQRL